MSNMGAASRHIARKLGGQRPAITVNDVAETVEQHLVRGNVVERLAWLDRDKLRQTIAENRAKAQARRAS